MPSGALSSVLAPWVRYTRHFANGGTPVLGGEQAALAAADAAEEARSAERDGGVLAHDFTRRQAEAQAWRNWDKFYRANEDRFFKDRHYFGEEAPELLGACARAFARGEAVEPRLLECGCGAGNTVYPLLELAAELHPGLPLRVSAFDFAPRAVALVRAKAAAHADGAVDAFVCDLAAGDVGDALPRRVGVGACHAATLVFVLSALAPESMPGAVRAVGACLAPGACVLVRDYAAGDLAEARLAGKGGGDSGSSRKLGERFYRRGDGTRAYFFEEAELVRLFEEHAGLRLVRSAVQARNIENRRMELTMRRRWVQAVFERPRR